MNDAHLHILVNHFPIIGTIIGLGILITGLVLRNDILKNTAYILFIIAAIFGFLSMYTGEGAEALVEDMPTVGKEIIHEHEEIAEKFVFVMYATAVFSILSLIASIKKHKLAKIVSIITLVLAIVAAVLAKNVATSGGEVRHTEIREAGENPINDTID